MCFEGQGDAVDARRIRQAGWPGWRRSPNNSLELLSRENDYEIMEVLDQVVVFNQEGNAHDKDDNVVRGNGLRLV